MVYLALLNTRLKQTYSMLGRVISTKDDFYLTIYKKDISYYVIAEEFVEGVLGWDNFSVFIENFRVISDTSIVLVGKAPKIIPRGIHYLDLDMYNFEESKDMMYKVVQQKASIVTKTDEASMYDKVRDIVNSEEDELFFNSFIIKHSYEIRSLIKKLIAEKDDIDEEINAISSRLRTSEAAVEEKSNDLKLLRDTFKKTQDELRVAESNLSNIRNLVYERNGFHIPELAPVTVKNKKVLYFKEISEVSYLGTFIKMLQKALNIKGFKCSIHVFEKTHSNDSLKLYKDYKDTRFISQYELQRSDSITVGFDRSVLTAILSLSATDNIIILDRTGHDFPLVDGDVSNIYRMDVMGELEDNIYCAKNENIISYNTSTKVIPTIKNFNNLSDSIKLAEYTKLPIMIEMLREITTN